MDDNRDDRPGYKRLPRADASHLDDTPSARDGGVRRVRRASNWTAAALIASVAATTGYFAHASHAVTPAASGKTGTATTRTASNHTACVAAPVATSGGSSVTVSPPASGNCATGTISAGNSRTVPTWRGGDD
jgi:hypothetical protein